MTAYLDARGPLPDAVVAAVACSTCGAPIGGRCTTPNGAAHPERVVDFLKGLPR